VIGKVTQWVDDAGIGYLRARYRADKNGLREARDTAARIAKTGWTVVDVQQTGGHLNAGRSAAKSLVGLGLLGATGMGFVGTSHDPGEIIVTFAKDLAEPTAPVAAAPVAPHAGRATNALPPKSIMSRIFAQQPELNTSFGFVAVNSLKTVGQANEHDNSVQVVATVTNRETRAWTGFELEAVFYRPADGEAVDAARQKFITTLEPGVSRRVDMRVDGLRAGDFGVLVAITRVLVDRKWY
jgi:hypothetical protein